MFVYNKDFTNSLYKRFSVYDVLTGHADIVSIIRPGFSYVMVFFVSSELRCEVIVRFIDIGGIVDSLFKLSFHISLFMRSMVLRAHQTRQSGRLLRLGFNEIAHFLSKREVLVALSVFSSPYFFHQ